MPTHSSNMSDFPDSKLFHNHTIDHTDLPVTTDGSFEAFKILNDPLDHNYTQTEDHMQYRSLHDTIQDGKFPYTKMNSRTISENTSDNSIQPTNIEKSYNQVKSTMSKKQTLTNFNEYPPTPGSSFGQREKISGAKLSFHHISYEVKIQKTLCSKPVIKTILDDVR